MSHQNSVSEVEAPRVRLRFKRQDETFYTASDDSLAETLLGLLCHGSAVAGSDIVLGSLTRSKAKLLACYMPARVQAESADPHAVSLLGSRGVHVEVCEHVSHVDARTQDAAAASEMCDRAETPESFRDELRLHLLAGLQRGRLDTDWMTATPETRLGAGGGGT